MRNLGHLIIFVKEPRVGKVKTRLAEDIGPINATFWYRRQLDHLLNIFKPSSTYTRHLFVTPHRGLKYFRTYTKQGWRLCRQSPGDLGEKMKNAFLSVGHGPRVLIGSDIPAVSAQHIELAFKQLNSVDAIFGPAQDGGYWLIGLSRFVVPPNLKHVRWSSQYALSDTLSKFGPKVRVKLIQTLKDVDRGSDLQTLTA
tara:strand:- start:149 stop:742 length:594 start_codon:yes stop_codon:yes gene_type:complete